VIALDPTQAQAWLTRATILQVTGDYDAARQAAARLATLGPPLAAVTCAAQLASLTGAAVQAYATLLRAVLLDRTRAETTEGLWSLTVLAEIAARLGRNAEAEQHLRSALALGPRDGCVLGAYADLLLDQRRFCDVTSLLRNEAGADALLLRRALAAQEALSTGAEPGAAQALARELERRFNAAHQRGDTTHRREEARYRLHLGGQPRAALTLALENWASQKEPADARLVLECALAANDPDAADAVRAFIRRTRLQDVQLAALEKRFP
jgi:Tfp pilus assembly protein PilF